MTIITSGSKSFSADFQPSGINQGTEVFIELAAAMIAAGWIAVDFSDGANVITSIVPATFSDLNGTNNWQRFRAPTGTMEVVWQRGITGKSWKMLFDDDGYGVGTVTTMPVALGTEVALVGSRSAAATFTWASVGANNYKWQICVDSVPSAGGFYYFHMLSRVAGTAAIWRMLMFVPILAGTHPSADISPWVAYQAAASVTGNSSWTGWYKKGLVGALMGTSLVGNNDGPFPSLGIINPYTAQHDFQRIMFDDSSGGDIQIKGRSIDVFWPASPFTALPDGDTVNVATAWTLTPEGDPGALYRFSNILLPWPHGVTPVP